MRVLLVNPPPSRIVEPYYDTPPYPRTGLAYLAGYLRASGVDVHILDCKFDRLSIREGMERLKALRPNIVGFGAFTNEIIPAADFAKAIKEYDPGICTLIGSVHVTAIPEAPELLPRRDLLADEGRLRDGQEPRLGAAGHGGVRL